MYALVSKLVALCACLTAIGLAQSCEEKLENHLGTKTGYRFVANERHDKLEYPGCTPQKIWMLVRHGTRNPSREYITMMRTRLDEIRNLIVNVKSSDLVNSDVTLFEKWKVKPDDDDAKLLTSEGGNEMIELAERMQARLPSILPEIYSNTSYKFKYTHSKRTKKSAQYFTIGLFGRPTAKDVWFPPPSKKDPILRFYKLCDKWRKDVKKNPAAIVELIKFKRSEVAQKAVRKTEKKLGLTEKSLNYDDLQHMYLACGFETAWSRKKRSPWCSVFDLDTIKLVEYGEDLKYYWVDGYGYNITYKQACPASNDMFETLTDPEPYPKAVVYFTHSGTLLKMLAHFGLYKDKAKLRHNNMDDERLWRVSRIDPFGTNLAIVSYKCGKEQKLLMLHQERVVRFRSCPETDLCELSTIKTQFKDSIENCSFDEMCELDDE